VPLRAAGGHRYVRLYSVKNRAIYRSRPSGRRGAASANFFLNSWARSRRATLAFRIRWNRALSPLIA